jgi:hypothetical protein
MIHMGKRRKSSGRAPTGFETPPWAFFRVTSRLAVIRPELWIAASRRSMSIGDLATTDPPELATSLKRHLNVQACRVTTPGE